MQEKDRITVQTFFGELPTREEIDAKADKENYKQTINTNDLKSVGVANFGDTYIGNFDIKTNSRNIINEDIDGRFIYIKTAEKVKGDETGGLEVYVDAPSQSEVSWIKSASEHSTYNFAFLGIPFEISSEYGKPVIGMLRECRDPDVEYYWSVFPGALRWILTYNASTDTAYLLETGMALNEAGDIEWVVPKIIAVYKNVSSASEYKCTVNVPKVDFTETSIKSVLSLEPLYSFDDEYAEKDNFLDNLGNMVFNYKVIKHYLTDEDTKSGNLRVGGKTYFYGQVESNGSEWNLNNSTLKNINELSVLGSSVFKNQVNFYSKVDTKSGVSIAKELEVGGTAKFVGDVKVNASLTVSGTARTQGDLVTKKVKPLDDATYDIGNSSKHYKNIYLSNGIITGDSITPLTQMLQQKDGTIALTSDVETEASRAAAKEAELENRVPAAPADDGTYILKCSVTDGIAAYSWVKEE